MGRSERLILDHSSHGREAFMEQQNHCREAVAPITRLNYEHANATHPPRVLLA